MYDGGKGGIWIGNDLEDDLVELGRLTPVILVARQLDLVTLGPGLQDKGTGSHRIRRIVVSRFRRNDHSVTPGQVEQNIAIRLCQRDLDCQRVNDLYRSDIGIKRLLRVGRAFRTNAIKRELDVVGIHIRSVAEFDAFVQFECIDQTVIGNRPGLCKSRIDAAVGTKTRQSFENIGIGHRIDGTGRA